MNPSPPVPVFVVGSGRSGTTLAASLLNRLPRVHIAKETGYIGQNISLLRDIENADTLVRLIEIVNSWLEVERWNSRAGVSGFHEFKARHDLQGAAAFVHYVWQLDSPIPWEELEFIGDNTPLYVMCIPALLELFPNARFVHMVRDPRDVVCSVLKMRFGADDPVVAALEWHQTIGCWLMAERSLDPAHRIECRYESLCTSPSETMQRLTTFLGRDAAEAAAATDFAITGITQAGSGFEAVAKMPHHSRLSEPLNASRVGRFRRELTSDVIRRIEEIVQNGMLACGYQPTEWRTSPLICEDRRTLAMAMIRNLIKRSLRRITRR